MMKELIRGASFALTLSLLFFGVSTVSGAYAGTLHIALLDAAEVHGDVILLADLLPKDVPRFLREAAGKVSLGLAPQNGTSRRLSRLAVLDTLMANGFRTADFQIPDLMTVQRASHSITRDEAFLAIRQALAKSNNFDLPDFQPEDLSFSTVELPDQAFQLAVTDIAFDEFIGRARFRLWSASAPEVHPFYVTAQLSHWPSKLPTAPIPPGSTKTGIAELTPVLVEPGHVARLRLHSSNARILVEVKPLQSGHLGEVIRVRLSSNGKTFRARVLEGGELDATL